MSDGKPRRPSASLETLVVEVPIFNEADLRELERRCEAVMVSTGSLRSEARRFLRIVQAAIARHGEGAPAPAASPTTPLHVVDEDDDDGSNEQ